jgi:hypothetical protein
MNEMLDAALDYARWGWLVLPLVPGKKEPLTKMGFYDATTDEAQIGEWWGWNPDANIGIRVGSESNLFVIDVDNKGGKNGSAELEKLEMRYGDFPTTRTVKTPTGGFHFYFTFPAEWRDKLVKKELAPGVDLKVNGYVVTPPSGILGRDESYVTIVKSDMIPEVPDAWKEACVKEQLSPDDWERVRPRGSGPSICEEHGISMSDVLALPTNARKTGDGYLIKHPIHGATGDGNLSISTSLNLWKCFRCDTGGDPLTWIAVREGFISCEEAGPLDVGTTLKCKDVLRKMGLIQDQVLEQPQTGPDRRAAGCPVLERVPIKSAWYYDGEMSSVTIHVNGKPILKQLPEIMPVVVIDGPKTIEALLDVFHGHLYFEEDYNVTGPICAFLCNFVPQDPIIVGIIGPSGSIKTEMIRSFGEVQNQFCYPISSITENTLISGMDKNIDTIPLLRGRVLTIKDLTSLLSKKEEIRSAIFADFREFTDGFIHKEFGNGVKKEFHDIHSSILFASTPAIERYYSMYAELGTRMLFMRPQNDPIKARIKSRENQVAGIKPIRKTLQDAMLSFIDENVKRLMSERLPEIPKAIDKEIGEFCDLLAWLRHPLHHDRQGNIDELTPNPEFPTRLMNTICLLTQMHAFIYRRLEVGPPDLEFARRLIADNVQTNRAAIITYLTDEMQSTSTLSDRSHISPRSLLRPLDELTMLKITKRVSRGQADKIDLDGRTNHYRLSPTWSQLVQQLNSVIRLGGRIQKNNKSGTEQGEEPATPISPNHTVQLNDQARIVRIIYNEAKSDNGDNKKPRNVFVATLCARIRRNFSGLAMYPLEDLVDKLSSDPEMQAILTERTKEV